MNLITCKSDVVSTYKLAHEGDTIKMERRKENVMPQKRITETRNFVITKVFNIVLTHSQVSTYVATYVHIM